MEGNELIMGVASMILLFGGPAVVGIIALVMHYKKRKRMFEAMTKMVELGKKPDEIKQLFEISPPKQKKNGPGVGLLIGGIIIVGIAAGLALMGVVLVKTSILASAAFLLCLALGMVVAFYISRKRGKNNGAKLEE